MNITLPLPDEALYTVANNGALFPTKSNVPYQLRIEQAAGDDLPEGDVKIRITGYKGNPYHLLQFIAQTLKLPAGYCEVVIAPGKRGRVEVEIVEPVPEVATLGVVKHRL